MTRSEITNTEPGTLNLEPGTDQFGYLGPYGIFSDNMLQRNLRFQVSGRGGTKYRNPMSITQHQLLVGVAFQPRKEVAIDP